MGFRKRIWMSYVTLLIAVAILCAAAFTQMYMRQYRRDEYSTMGTLAQQISARMDQQVAIMQAAVDSVLSDTEILNTIRYLGQKDERDPYRTQLVDKIGVKLSQWFYAKNFYRVLYYNEKGDMAASYNMGQRRLNEKRVLSDLKWLDEVRNRKGAVQLIAPRTDEWSLTGNQRVYSLVKEIQGSGMGFLEVQVLESTLSDMLGDLGDMRRAVIFYEDRLFYTSDAEEEMAGVLAEIDLSEPGVREIVNPDSQKREIAAVSPLSDSGVRILLVSDSSVVWLKARSFVYLTIGVVLAFMALFFAYSTVVSQRLARPVVQLRRQIEKMDILGTDGALRLSDETDELGAFSRAFSQMVGTINNLLLEECEAEIQLQRARAGQREMEVLYLRSQINPHFLYNTLNTIQMKAAMHEDDAVVDMIRQLIRFFRNGMEHSAQIVSIRNEIEMVRAYLNIMVYRYPNVKTEFELDETLMDADIPNFVLQPLVENCFIHGLKERCYQGEIKITLRSMDAEHICICVSNGGDPVSEEKVEAIRRSLNTAREDEDGDIARRHIGLNNVFSRLKMYYPDPQCGLFFSPNPEGGLRVDVVIRTGCTQILNESESE